MSLHFHIEVQDLSERDEAALEEVWHTTRADRDVAASVLAILSHYPDALIDALDDLSHDQQWPPRRCTRCTGEIGRLDHESFEGRDYHHGCATQQAWELLKGVA